MGPWSSRGGGGRGSRVRPRAASPRLGRGTAVWRLLRAEPQTKASGVKGEPPAPSCDLSPLRLPVLQRKHAGGKPTPFRWAPGSDWRGKPARCCHRRAARLLPGSPSSTQPTGAGAPPETRRSREFSGLAGLFSRGRVSGRVGCGRTCCGPSSRDYSEEDGRERSWPGSASRCPGSRVFRRSTSCSTSTHR